MSHLRSAAEAADAASTRPFENAASHAHKDCLIATLTPEQLQGAIKSVSEAGTRCL